MQVFLVMYPGLAWPSHVNILFLFCVCVHVPHACLQSQGSMLDDVYHSPSSLLTCILFDKVPHHSQSQLTISGSQQAPEIHRFLFLLRGHHTGLFCGCGDTNQVLVLPYEVLYPLSYIFQSLCRSFISCCSGQMLTNNIKEKGCVQVTVPDYSPWWQGSLSSRNLKKLFILHPQSEVESNGLHLHASVWCREYPQWASLPLGQVNTMDMSSVNLIQTVLH